MIRNLKSRRINVMKRYLATLLSLSLLYTLLLGNVSGASKIVLRMGDNLPDRKTTWGAVVEKINAAFKAKHPNVEIITESYQDQPWQQKVQIYAASNRLPDIFKYWSFPAMTGVLATNGYLMALPEKEFAKFGFIPGMLDPNRYNGKLYGLPVTVDFWVIYYNKALFKQCGVKPPATIDDLIGSAKTFRSKGITPLITDGKDAWPLCITWDNLVGRTTGDFSLIQKALARKIKFTDPVFLPATKLYKQLIENKLFSEDLLTLDYGASRNLFGQEKAAMYLMGSWESGLSTDTSFADSFHKNLGVIKFPAGPKGAADDLMAWGGGNYVVNAKTKYKKLCIDYLKTYFSLYPKLAWQDKINIPALKVRTTAKDSHLSKDLIGILNAAKKTSGTPSLDQSTAEFKTNMQKYIQELTAGIKTPEQFLAALDNEAVKAAKSK
jgi:raffinose/stachyose/melibiose transport system substrate-binding protein